MSGNQDGFEQRLEELKRAYLKGLPAKIDDVAAAVAAATIATARADPAPGEGRDELTALLRAAHTLAGSAPTFGLPEIGDAAQDMEAAAEARLASPGASKNEPWPEIEGLLKKLRDAAAKALAEPETGGR